MCFRWAKCFVHRFRFLLLLRSPVVVVGRAAPKGKFFFLSTAESECATDVDNSNNAKKQQPKNNNNNQYRIFWRGKVKRATFVPCPPLLMAITSSCLLPAELVTTVHGALLFTWPLDEGNLLLVGCKVGCMRCFI